MDRHLLDEAPRLIQALSHRSELLVASAYRIPRGKFPIVDRFLTQETDANTPITRWS
jgi:hypothetical protein